MTSLQTTLLAKLDHLQNCVARVEAKLPFSLQELGASHDLQDIISINIQRAIQICVDISSLLIAETSERPPETMAEAFSVLQKLGWITGQLSDSLKKSVGLRNVLVHEYSEIDWQIVHDVAHQHLQTFREFASAVAGKAGIALNK